MSNDTDSNSTSTSNNGGTTCPTELRYVEKNQAMKTLVVLCRGLKGDDGKLLIDVEEEPWKYFKISTIKPNANDYKDEIDRRWKLFVSASPGRTVQPRPKAWPVSKLLEWLDENPITAADDIAFLKTTVNTTKENAKDAFDAKKAEKEQLEKSWTGPHPYLRLIHAIVDNDSIKKAYLTRHDISSSRLEVENRKSAEKKGKTVWQMVADKWNDAEFSPTTEELPDLHSDFIVEETIFHFGVEDMAKATAEKCEAKFSSMMVELNRVIGNWERSGQGDGGIEEGDDEEEARELGHPEYGSLENRTRGALDQRHSFVGYNQSYLLYLWHMLDKHSLLGSSLQRLNDNVSAANGGEGVPSVFDVDDNTDGASLNSKSDSTSKNELANLSQWIKELGESNERIAQRESEANERIARMESEATERIARENERNRSHSRAENLRQGIDKLKAEKRRLSFERWQNKKNKPMFEFLTEQIDEISNETLEKETELLGIAGTPKRKNRTPESATLGE